MVCVAVRSDLEHLGLMSRKCNYQQLLWRFACLLCSLRFGAFCSLMILIYSRTLVNVRGVTVNCWGDTGEKEKRERWYAATTIQVHNTNLKHTCACNTVLHHYNNILYHHWSAYFCVPVRGWYCFLLCHLVHLLFMVVWQWNGTCVHAVKSLLCWFISLLSKTLRNGVSYPTAHECTYGHLNWCRFSHVRLCLAQLHREEEIYVFGVNRLQKHIEPPAYHIMSVLTRRQNSTKQIPVLNQMITELLDQT